MAGLDSRSRRHAWGAFDTSELNNLVEILHRIAELARDEDAEIASIFEEEADHVAEAAPRLGAALKTVYEGMLEIVKNG